MKVLAPELDLYQDEPRQLPTGALGKDALLRLRFEARQDRSILSFMERRAPLLVQKDLPTRTLRLSFPSLSFSVVAPGDRYRRNSC